jgi:hypothetical protein
MSTDPTTPHKKQSFWKTVPGILAQVAAIIVAITGLIAVLPHDRNKRDDGSPTPSPIPDGTPLPTAVPSVTAVGAIRVFSVVSKDDKTGKYFDFEASDLDAALGRDNWDTQVIWAAREPSGKRRPIRVWRTSGGGPTNAHGRYEDRPKSGDWHQGNYFYAFEHPK